MWASECFLTSLRAMNTTPLEDKSFIKLITHLRDGWARKEWKPLEYKDVSVMKSKMKPRVIGFGHVRLLLAYGLVKEDFQVIGLGVNIAKV